MEPTELIENLSSVFRFLPSLIVISITSFLPIIEIGLGTLLVFSLYHEKIKNKKKLILSGTTALFGMFWAFSIYGYIVGMKNDCGCFGGLIKTSFEFGVIFRNFVLLITSLVIIKINTINYKSNIFRK